MRLPGPLGLALCASLAAGSAASSFAQESQQDLAERIVKEQEEIRRKSLDKAMSAPARAWDHADSDPFHPVNSEDAAVPPAAAPIAKAAAPGRPKAPGGGFPWVLMACLLPVIPLALLAIASWRKWRFEGN